MADKKGQKFIFLKNEPDRALQRSEEVLPFRRRVPAPVRDLAADNKRKSRRRTPKLA